MDEEPVFDPDRPIEEGQPGPGIRPRPGVDPTVVTAWIFIVLGFTPVSFWERVLGSGYFGPIEISAILAMVGVLFGFIAVLRALDLSDRRLLWAGGLAVGVGLLRLLLLPLL